MTLQTPDKTRPTLKSIAYLTGLGISTVSRALKGDEQIAPETRARVKLIAQQIGYRPNRAGVRLRTGKTNVITVVLNSADGGSGFFSDFVYGISDGLKDTNYHLVVTPYSLSDPMEPLRYIQETGSADGVILSRTQPNDPRVRFLVDNNIPFATHGRTEMGIEHPFHDYDNEAFAREATNILARRNRQHIALISPPANLTYYKHTHQGFEHGLLANAQTAIPMSSIDTDSSLTLVREAAVHAIENGTRIDGVVCSASPTALAFAEGLSQGGMQLGKDFDVVTKHTIELLGMLSPQLISIPEDFHEAGFSTARKVIGAIEGQPVNTLQHVVGMRAAT